MKSYKTTTQLKVDLVYKKNRFGKTKPIISKFFNF